MKERSPLSFPILLVALVAACNPSKTAFQMGIPGTRTELTVSRVVPRFGFLDTTLYGAGWTLRTFLPASEVCARVVATESGVEYLSEGPYGTLVRDGERCVPSGIGSLREWRNRRPRDSSARESIIPSAQASYHVVYEDEEVAFLRGNFPLAYKLGFAGMGDLIAVVPITALCRGPIDRTTSTLEYFPAGRNVLTLSSSEGRCNIQGLIRPLTSADLDSG